MALDIGTGDGAFAYRSARANPDRLFIGIDSNAENMFGYSCKALQKPAKGGVPNVFFVEANVGNLPPELAGTADAISIIFPWGSLLRAVVAPDMAILTGLRRLCRPNAKLRIVFSLDEIREANLLAELDVPVLSQDYLRTALFGAYREAGFAMEISQLDRSSVQQIPSTWAKKLSYGSPRVFYEIYCSGEATNGNLLAAGS